MAQAVGPVLVATPLRAYLVPATHTWVSTATAPLPFRELGLDRREGRYHVPGGSLSYPLWGEEGATKFAG